MIQRALDVAVRHRVALLAIAIAGLSALAWSNRFIQDDAFISFRYAQNLAQGAGLTWNPGERVEGYTNFLWTLLMAIPFLLGSEPAEFSLRLSWLFFPASLLLTARIAAAVSRSPWAPLSSVVLLGTNYTFSAYATGGLETQLHVFLLLGVTLFAVRANRAPPAAGISIATSLLAGAALLTRMDSAIFLVVLYVYIAFEHYRRDPRGVARSAALLVLPGAILVCAWLAWKLSYYGSILPNTYYAKMAPVSGTWYFGARYLWTFLLSYWLWPIFALPLLLARPVARAFSRPIGLLVTLVVVWCFYLIRIGGDFMEFRQLVPILPSFFVLLTWLLVSVCEIRWLSAVAATAVLAGSVLHERNFTYVHGIEPVSVLQSHIDEPPYLWAQTGRVLGELFGGSDEPVRIAVTAAGALPFYASLPTIDMLGLSDVWVARHGFEAPLEHASPGHYRVATFDYLARRGVNLLIGNPWVSRRIPGPRPPFGSQGLGRFDVRAPAAESIPADARMKVLEINLDAGYRIYVLYLMPNAHIDEVIRKENILVHPLIRPTS